MTINRTEKKGNHDKACSQPKGTDVSASTASKSHRVLFKFTFPDARMVCLIGTFNDWHPAVSPMISMGQGLWMKELMLPPGTYQYALVVDGERCVSGLKRISETSRNSAAICAPDSGAVILHKQLYKKRLSKSLWRISYLPGVGPNAG